MGLKERQRRRGKGLLFSAGESFNFKSISVPQRRTKYSSGSLHLHAY